MRIIKFRAWDKVYKKFHYFTINDALRGIRQTIIGAACLIEDMPKNQYTGLKDKNGVEIYEGDILSYHLKKGWEVFFEDGCCYIMHDGHSFLFEKMRAIESVIIGNIYENPQLLEEK